MVIELLLLVSCKHAIPIEKPNMQLLVESTQVWEGAANKIKLETSSFHAFNIWLFSSIFLSVYNEEPSVETNNLE